MLIADFTR